MKPIPMILLAITMVFGLSSCETYVDGGYAYRPNYRPGYAYSPGYVRPGYSRPYYSTSRSYYSAPSRSYYRQSSYRGRHDHDHDRRDWSNRRDSGRSRYYRSSGASTSTRVNVGRVGLSNSNFLRINR